jgi:ribosome-associated toxin RatA of RatAB toxin-antitoxin module
LDTSIGRLMHADPRIVLGLAAAVEDWPRLLPHYRWVRVLTDDGHGQRVVEMAARRDIALGLSVPLWWTARQTVLPERVEFVHTGGLTRGMKVAWTCTPAGGGAIEVRIRHVFAPRWPIPEALVQLIVGEYFVNGVARRTIRRLGELAEARTSSQARHS